MKRDAKKLFVFSSMIALLILMVSCSVKEGQELYFEQVGELKVRASNYLEYNKPSKLVDNNMATFWHSNQPAGELGWVAISYNKDVTIYAYTLARRSDMSSQAPVEFILEGALTNNFPTDKEKWELIDRQENQTWGDTNIKTYTIKQPKSFKHYRLRIIRTGDGAFASITEWRLEK